MTLVKLINLTESLKRNPNSSHKWNEISELLNSSVLSPNIQESLFILLKRDLTRESSQNDALLTLEKTNLLLKFPQNLQIELLEILKTISNRENIYKIIVNISEDLYGLLVEYLLEVPTLESLEILNFFFKKNNFMEESVKIWLLQSILNI